jgi:hypothetical protein
MDTDIDLIALDLINSRLTRGDMVFVFTTGNFRGKLVSATYLEDALPSPTYLLNHSLDSQIEPCIQLTYAPAPRSRDRVKDPATFNFTRNPVFFNIPARFFESAITLHQLRAGQWMLAIDTSVKK